MSAILNTAARQQIGDGANAVTLSVTTTAAVIEIPAAMRGKYVKLIASAGTVYLSSGKERLNAAGSEGPTTATAANGFEVVSGTPESVYIPDSSALPKLPYRVSALGTEAADLKVITVSS